MFSIKLADCWSSGVKRFLKPSELVRGLMNAYRMLIAPLENIPMLGNSDAPCGHGKLYSTLTLKLTDVGSTKPVAGIDIVISGGTSSSSINSDKFPYMITGAPSGIIFFSKCVDGDALLLYSDFIERDGVYYFAKDPTQYGLISTATGDTKITFVVSKYNANVTSFQDTENRYSGSGDYSVNSNIRYWNAFSGVLPSNGALALQSCGITTSMKESTLDKVWMEGNTLFAVNSNGELLKDAVADDKTEVGTAPAPGNPLTNNAFYRCKIYPFAGRLYCLLGSDADVDITESNLTEVLPELAGLSLPYSTVSEMLTDRGYITIIRTQDYPELYSGKALDSRLNKLSTQYLVNFAEVSVSNPESSYAYYGDSYIVPAYEDDREYTRVIPDVSDYNYIYIYYTTDRRKTAQPLSYRGITPRNALFGNFPEFGIMRIAVQPEDGYKLALSDNGEAFNRGLKCGDLIKAISLVVNNTNERNYRDDAIVNHITIPEIEVGAGGSVVLKLNWSE